MNKIENDKVKPFLKWAGGKLRIVSQLKKKFPKGTRFVEPFLGAGSVSLNVEYPSYVVNDFNADLACVWRTTKEKGTEFVEECRKLFTKKNNIASAYYDFRQEFNQTKSSLRKATLFVYLNRHCFNGLCRYNAKGGFNVPFGKYTKPYFPEKELNICVQKIQNFKIYNKDFREIFDMVGPGDVVYCDPPYVPLSATSHFTSYSSGGFGLEDQIDLARCSRIAADNGAVVVVSNHYNWYTAELYGKMFKAKLNKIKVSRTISSKTNERSPVEEIMAVFE